MFKELKEFFSGKGDEPDTTPSMPTRVPVSQVRFSDLSPEDQFQKAISIFGNCKAMDVTQLIKDGKEETHYRIDVSNLMNGIRNDPQKRRAFSDIKESLEKMRSGFSDRSMDGKSYFLVSAHKGQFLIDMANYLQSEPAKLKLERQVGNPETPEIDVVVGKARCFLAFTRNPDVIRKNITSTPHTEPVSSSKETSEETLLKIKLTPAEAKEIAELGCLRLQKSLSYTIILDSSRYPKPEEVAQKMAVLNKYPDLKYQLASHTNSRTGNVTHTVSIQGVSAQFIAKII